MKHLLTFILAFLSLGLAVQMVSCSGQEDAPTKTYFTDAFFYGLQEGDTIDLGNSSDTAVSLRLFYGCGVLDVYRAFVSWKSSDTDVVKTHKGLSTIKEDSCYSLCALSPGGKAGTVDVAVTMQFSTSQRTLHFVVKTDYSRKKWGLPEGSFDDTISVGSIVKDAIITMVFVKADTLYTTGGEEGRQMLIDSGPDNIRVQGYRIHSRYLKDYYISQTEVTNQLWENVMGEKSFSAASGRDKPVRLASYWEVQNFLQRLNEITGRHYRLPWEAEWEFAARGGRMRKGYLYAGSDYLNEVAWHVDNSRLSDGMLSPQPVASKKPMN